MATLGERIKELRKKNLLTQVDLAQKMNVTKGTVSTWETDSRKPSFETLDDLCELFNVCMDYLMGRSDEPNSYIMTQEDANGLGAMQIEDDLSEYAVKYARLDEYGRRAVESIILAEFNRCRDQKSLHTSGTYSARIHIRKEDSYEE